MSLDNDSIIKFLNFILDSELSLTYKKVFTKTFIHTYLNDNNKDKIKDIIKNKSNEIYDYLFLTQYDKVKNNPDKLKLVNEAKRKYYQKNREKVNENNKMYQRKNKEINILKEENEKLKNLLSNQDKNLIEKE